MLNLLAFNYATDTITFTGGSPETYDVRPYSGYSWNIFCAEGTCKGANESTFMAVLDKLTQGIIPQM